MDFLRIPSITRNRESVEKAAHWIINRLKRTTDSVELIKTGGNPAIIAEWLPQIKSKPNQKVPTIVFYVHYDVQPGTQNLYKPSYCRRNCSGFMVNTRMDWCTRTWSRGVTTGDYPAS